MSPQQEFYDFIFNQYIFSSTPNSSTTADSGVDNPTFRIESEGLNNGALSEIASSGILTKEGKDGQKMDGNDNMSNNGGIKLTSTTNTTSQSEHPDSAVWNKSPFSKKYKTQTENRGNKILAILGAKKLNSL